MKQHITPEQLVELGDKGRKNLKKWWKPQAGDLVVRFYSETVPPSISRFIEVYDIEGDRDISDYFPLLSIGQMIELLGTKIDRIVRVREEWRIITPIEGGSNNEYYSSELCDALWIGVKEVLKKDILEER